MLKPPFPEDESDRLIAVKALKIMDTPVEEKFERIARLTQALFKTPIVGISFMDDKRQWFKSIVGIDIIETPREDAFCAYTILNNDILIVPDTLTDPRFSNNPYVINAPHVRFYAGCPLRIKNGKIVGSICLISDKQHEFNSIDATYLKDIAHLIESELDYKIMSNTYVELMTKLEHTRVKSLVDPLTRLWNRAGINQLLEHYFLNLPKQNKAFALGLLDIDNFKTINDHYGHINGDRALKSVSQCLLKSCRDEDTVGRWGGDEFILLINSNDPKMVHTIAERMRAKIEKTPIVSEDTRSFSLTISIGMTFIDLETPLSLEEMISRADQSLYKAKQHGKNLIILENPP